MTELRFGVVLSTFPARGIADLGILADKLGFLSAWIPDHLADLPPVGDRIDPWVLLGAIGANTTRIMLCPGVTDPTRIHPAKTASIIATLDDLTNGRACVGIGAGEVMNLTRYGMPWEEDPRRRRMKLAESVAVMRGLLDSSVEKPFSFNGEFFQISNARLDQKPAHHVQFYIGSLGATGTLRLVGEIGDGWFPVVNTLESFKKRCAIIDSAALAKNRNPAEIDKVHSAFVIVANDPNRVKKDIEVLKPLLLTLSSSTILREMQEFGVELISPAEIHSRVSYQNMDPSVEGANYLGSIAKTIPDDLVRKYALVGKTFSEIREQLEPFIEAGARHIVVFDVHSILASNSPEECAVFLREFSNNIMKNEGVD